MTIRFQQSRKRICGNEKGENPCEKHEMNNQHFASQGLDQACGRAGAEEQLLQLAKAHGYERVWCDPRDNTVWFADRKHPDKDGVIQVIPLDYLLITMNSAAF